ncbi:SDR family NAD(P)-dependent oxidoreductase [Seongchinamella sediminis]|uniref:SDR family NAD(P)-dependent oxidoreductase n=1 Tax=Seongchinamella sediminis TaxID=2283635 RepID=A0A3L7DYN6_9GAMM|nr:SDR family NAD(P)-dependent oxidoreductase [Seongchinamella sediminis]RLQ21775.1 SDR family NAD(P)-dependent oxidoreductase [Seongchinamella sediminis]
MSDFKPTDPAAQPGSTGGGFLELPRFNAVVVGNGAIGTAILERLLALPALEHGFLLARRPGGAPGDSRVSSLYVDAEQPQSIADAAANVSRQVERIHLLFNTVGMLHADGQRPEKRLRDLDPDQLQRSFAINATFLPLLCQAFSPLLKHPQPAVLASLSARVGSIEDNGLGGWYSYRAAKAAHNMLLRTLSREWKISHRNVSLVALHPGTVESRLSAPFISASYRNRVLSPDESAAALLAVIAQLTPGRTGDFHDWQGEPIPW